jgi:hypothetical protein
MAGQDNEPQRGWYDEIMQSQYYDELIPAYQALQGQMAASSSSLFLICARSLSSLGSVVRALAADQTGSMNRGGRPAHVLWVVGPSKQLVQYWRLVRRSEPGDCIMKSLPFLLVAGLGLPATILAVKALAGRQEQGRVYSVAQVRAGLVDHPQAWVGQTVQVRGVAWPCLGWATGPCLVRSPILTDPEADAGLAFAPQRANLLLAFIRTVPLVGNLLPPGQLPHWGELVPHRVQVRALPLASCTYWPCYAVVLVDAAL